MTRGLSQFVYNLCNNTTYNTSLTNFFLNLVLMKLSTYAQQSKNKYFKTFKTSTLKKLLFYLLYLVVDSNCIWLFLQATALEMFPMLKKTSRQKSNVLLSVRKLHLAGIWIKQWVFSVLNLIFTLKQLSRKFRLFNILILGHIIII